MTVDVARGQGIRRADETGQTVGRGAVGRGAVGRGAVPAGFGVLLVLAALNLRPAITSLSPLLPEIEASYGLASPRGVLLVALPTLVLGLGAPLAPWLARRLGQSAAVLVGLLVLAVGLLVRSLWAPVLFPATVVAAVGITIVAVALPAVVKAHDPGRQGHWTAVYGLAMGLGSAAAPFVTGLLDRADVPVRESLGVWALLAGIAVLAWRLPRWTRERERQPEATDGSDQDCATSPRTTTRGGSAFGVLRVGAARALAAYFGLQAFLFFLLITYLPQYARSAGLDTTTAALLLSFFSLLTMVGSWVAPRRVATLADSRLFLALLSAGSAIGMVVLVTGGPVLLAVVLLGLAQGSIFPAALGLMVVRAADHRTATALSMTSQCLGFSGAALALVILAQVHHEAGSWTGLWAAALVAVVLQGVVGWWAGASEVVSEDASVQILSRSAETH